MICSGAHINDVVAQPRVINPRRIGEHGRAEVTEVPVMGMAVSFPFSPNAIEVEYKVNHVYFELFGADE